MILFPIIYQLFKSLWSLSVLTVKAPNAHEALPCELIEIMQYNLSVILYFKYFAG
jgi:hypothetical protein